MRLAQHGAGVALFFIGITVGCSQGSPSPESGTDPDARTGSSSQPIQGVVGDPYAPGALDGTKHPYAVGVCAGYKGSCSGYCSGALILPNVVVTARHCVDESPQLIDCTKNPSFGARHGSMWITTSPDMQQSSVGWHQVKSVATPADAHICGNDIALLILSSPVSGTEATPATPAVQYAMTDLNRYPSRRVTAIGYGNTGPTGFTAGDRRIRGGIHVLCIPGDDLIPCPDGFNDNEFYTGDGVCEGDSGSSAFEDKSVTGGKPLTFGVLSRGGDNSADTGGAPTLCKGGLYTRLDKFRDLIVQTADAASSNWTLYPKPAPDWTVYVPPPVTADAGVDAAPKPPAPLADGEPCETGSQCKSKVCADTGSGTVCTEACDETAEPSTCQDGYVCRDSICIVAPAEAAPTSATTGAPSTVTTTSGCQTATAGSATSGSSPWRMLASALACALALGARRRRRA